MSALQAVVWLSGMLLVGVTGNSPSCDLEENASKMVCRQLTCELDLYQELTSTKKLNIKELVIESSEFRFFMKDSFLGTKFTSIHLKDCSILDLSDSPLAFEGLENSLETLTVDNDPFTNNWNWSHLKKLRKLKTLAVRESALEALPDTFQDISGVSLDRVDLRGNGISWIPDATFSNFAEMTNLYLISNKITSLKRSMFPKPSKLQGLNLKNNQLSSLPEDMFTDMPDLHKLVLVGNPLWSLDEKTFGPVWSQLTLFHLTDSYLRCDCRMKWITRTPHKVGMFFALCESPSQLKGRYVLTLKPEELWC